MEKEKSVVWADKFEIEKMMDDMAERIKEIPCPFCHMNIKIPLVARDIDITILEHHIEGINKFADEIIKFIEETYGIDVRYTFLLKTIVELQNKYLKPIPKNIM